MSLTKFLELDVLYDDKEEGDIIDSSEWNDNFTEIESVANANRTAFNSLVDMLETDASAIKVPAITTDGATTLGGQLQELDDYCDDLKEVTDMFNGISAVGTSVTNDATKIPTSKAVFEAMHNHTNKTVLDGITGVKTSTISNNPDTDVASITALTTTTNALNTSLTTLINTTKTSLENQIEDIVIDAGAGDMTKNTYDSNNDGVVNKADEATNLTGLTATVAQLNSAVDTLGDITATPAELNTLDGITATTAELNYCDGVTSNIQTQINTLNTSINTKLDTKLEADDIAGLGTKSVLTTATLAVANWAVSGTVYSYTVSNAMFVTTGYAYIVTPSPANMAEYAECGIKALDVTTAGSLVFEANECPENNLTVTILKIQTV